MTKVSKWRLLFRLFQLLCWHKMRLFRKAVLIFAYRRVDAQLEFSLGNSFLYSLAVRCVARRLVTAFPVFHQTADLINGTSGILFTRAEPVHAAEQLLLSQCPRCQCQRTHWWCSWLKATLYPWIAITPIPRLSSHHSETRLKPPKLCPHSEIRTTAKLRNRRRIVVVLKKRQLPRTWSLVTPFFCHCSLKSKLWFFISQCLLM